MSLNFGTVGSVLSGISSALSSAGLTPGSASFNTALQSIGSLVSSNPNATAEQQLCAQIIQFANNPQLVAKLTMTLITEQGLPPAAAALAMTLMTPGTNIAATALEIEQIIKG